jgi:hypothetical protein
MVNVLVLEILPYDFLFTEAGLHKCQFCTRVTRCITGASLFRGYSVASLICGKMLPNGCSRTGEASKKCRYRQSAYGKSSQNWLLGLSTKRCALSFTRFS